MFSVTDFVGVATKRGVGHGLGHGVGHGVGHGLCYGLCYGLPVVNFIKQFTPESLKILIIIRHKWEGIAPIKAKTQIRYILVLKHNVNLVYMYMYEYYLCETYISSHIYCLKKNVKKAYSDVLGSSIVMVQIAWLRGEFMFSCWFYLLWNME